MIIFLIGYMGSGKSTIGKELSEILSIPFIDMDEQIEKNEGLSISEIFAFKGEKYFRDLEHDFLVNLDPDSNVIIATGGGAPCFNDNMTLLSEKGVVVWLMVSVKNIVNRIKGNNKRPLIKEKTESELYQYIRSHLQERVPYYQRANIKVRSLGSRKTIAHRIAKKL